MGELGEMIGSRNVYVLPMNTNLTVVASSGIDIWKGGGPNKKSYINYRG